MLVFIYVFLPVTHWHEVEKWKQYGIEIDFNGLSKSVERKCVSSSIQCNALNI